MPFISALRLSFSYKSLFWALNLLVPWADIPILPGIRMGLWALLVAAVANLCIHVLQNLVQPASYLPPWQPPRLPHRALRLLGPGVLGLGVSAGYASLSVPAIPMAMPIFMLLSGLVVGGIWWAICLSRTTGPAAPYLWNVAAWAASFLAIGCLY